MRNYMMWAFALALSGPVLAQSAVLVDVTEVSVGDANCSEGGLQVDSGIDDGGVAETPDDGVLGPSEIDQSDFICNGSDGSLVRLDAIEAGATCANGGTQFSVGLDNGDGAGTADDDILDDDEIDQSRNFCNGEDGETGAQGNAALTVTTPLANGDDNCPAGGTRIDVGVDNGDGDGTANDGILAADEIDSTAYVCAGKDGEDGFLSIVRVRPLPDGDNRCANGGVLLESGLDNGDGNSIANNGSLGDDEIDFGTVLCDGKDGFVDEDGDGIDDRAAAGGTSANCSSASGSNGLFMAFAFVLLTIRRRRRA